MGFDVEYLGRQPEKLYSNFTCDGCGCKLDLVGPGQESGSTEYIQPDDTLQMKLEGGVRDGHRSLRRCYRAGAEYSVLWWLYQEAM